MLTQYNVSTINPLKPSVIMWLHFRCSVKFRPKLQYLPFPIECPNVRN